MSEFTVTEDWQGEIFSLDEQHFEGRMIPTYEVERELIIQFSRTDVPAVVSDRVRLGATFRWLHGFYRDEQTDVNTNVDVFDIDPLPGTVPVTNPRTPSLAELAQRSQIAK